MSDFVLLQGLTINHCNLHHPHARYCIQDDSITPEPAVQHIPAVLLEAKWSWKGTLFILQPVCLSQVAFFM